MEAVGIDAVAIFGEAARTRRRLLKQVWLMKETSHRMRFCEMRGHDLDVNGGLQKRYKKGVSLKRGKRR